MNNLNKGSRYVLYNKDIYRGELNNSLMFLGVCVVISLILIFFPKEYITSRIIILDSLGILYSCISLVIYSRKMKGPTIETLIIDERGISLMPYDSSDLVFSYWFEIRSVEFCEKKEGLTTPFCMYVCKKNGKEICFRLRDYYEAINPYQLKEAIIYFSGKDDIVDVKYSFRHFGINRRHNGYE